MTGDEPVRIPIEDSLDLHAFAPADVRAVVDDYLQEAHRRGFREVRLIHGRGTGAQRASVQAFLGRHPLVESYGDAPPERGGWGATIVRLCPAGGGLDPLRTSQAR
jgi:DNA-nicking Smr family endonuclease